MTPATWGGCHRGAVLERSDKFTPARVESQAHHPVRHAVSIGVSVQVAARCHDIDPGTVVRVGSPVTLGVGRADGNDAGAARGGVAVGVVVFVSCRDDHDCAEVENLLKDAALVGGTGALSAQAHVDDFCRVGVLRHPRNATAGSPKRAVHDVFRTTPLKSEDPHG